MTSSAKAPSSGSRCRWVGAFEVQEVQIEQPAELGDRRGVVVDAQIGPDVETAAVRRALLPDRHRRRLEAAAISTGCLAGLEAVQQSLPEVRLRRVVRLGHRVDDLWAVEQVALRR